MRLIDANKLFDEEFVRNHPVMWKVLESQPTVDAEVVVRCKNCVNWIPNGGGIYGTCCELNIPRDKYKDDYCSKGEPYEIK